MGINCKFSALRSQPQTTQHIYQEWVLVVPLSCDMLTQ
ncbi:hypothetical protein AALB_0395 [Agarivorans albus MKT 106]|uniref:Uncharacterized protein n=1 Tax=Agarivorans albus MKT 106 TaxID=1331007 RepID=R9PG23_AGAAL|nr:hypothetical protein AALB_0395 [Agarivorans albus MKT 106]